MLKFNKGAFMNIIKFDHLPYIEYKSLYISSDLIKLYLTDLFIHYDVQLHNRTNVINIIYSKLVNSKTFYKKISIEFIVNIPNY